MMRVKGNVITVVMKQTAALFRIGYQAIWYEPKIPRCCTYMINILKRVVFYGEIVEPVNQHGGERRSYQ